MTSLCWTFTCLAVTTNAHLRGESQSMPLAQESSTSEAYNEAAGEDGARPSGVLEDEMDIKCGPLSLNAPPTQLRVMLVGDSITEGFIDHEGYQPSSEDKFYSGGTCGGGTCSIGYRGAFFTSLQKRLRIPVTMLGLRITRLKIPGYPNYTDAFDAWSGNSMHHAGVLARLRESAHAGLRPDVVYFGPNINDLLVPDVGTCTRGDVNDGAKEFMHHLKEQVAEACSLFQALVVVSTTLHFTSKYHAQFGECVDAANKAILEERGWPCDANVIDLSGSEFDRAYSRRPLRRHPRMLEYELLGRLYGENLANTYTKCRGNSTSIRLGKLPGEEDFQSNDEAMLKTLAKAGISDGQGAVSNGVAPKLPNALVDLRSEHSSLRHEDVDVTHMKSRIVGVSGRYIARFLAGVAALCVLYSIWTLFRYGAKQRQSPHFRYLDGLRFPLTVWHIGFHYLNRAEGSVLTSNASPCADMIKRGRLPVIYFLLLSGFLTNMTWKDDGHYAVNFVKRFFRLYACYIIALGLLWVMVSSPIWERTRAWDVRDVAIYTAMIQPWTGDPYRLNGPGWYIASLCACILVGPAVFWCLPRSGFRLACVASLLILMVPLWTMILFWTGHGTIDTQLYKKHFYPHPLSCFSLFLAGMCIFETAGKSRIAAADASPVSRAYPGAEVERNSSGGAAVVDDTRTSPYLDESGSTVVLATIGDMCFLLILGLAFFPSNYFPAVLRDDHCSARDWAEDGCTGARVLVTGISPMLWSTWLVLSCYYGGTVAYVLSSPWCFGDIEVFGNPTLSMFLFQDAVAMFMMRISGERLDGPVLQPPRLRLEPVEFASFLVILWSFAFIWSYTIERWLISTLNSFVKKEDVVSSSANLGVH